jgi:hypothetical protein
LAEGAVPNGKKAKLVTPSRDRRFDRLFFSITSVLMLVTVYIGFAPSYYQAGVFHAPLPSIALHIHAVAFSCWMPLLVIQTSLVAARRVDIHRRLGITGFLLGCAMVILGVWAAVDTLARGFSPPGMNAAAFFIIPMTDMLIFGTLLCLAYRHRRDPAHKRMIYIATTGLLVAAIARIPLLPGIQKSGVIAALYSYIFLLLLMIYDLYSIRKVHRVTLWASAFVIFVQQVRFPLADAAVWQAFATWVQHIAR